MTHAAGQQSSVGLIGLGLMGSGLAAHVHRAGRPTRLLIRSERDEARCAELLESGARRCANAREVAQSSEVIVICVTGSPQVEETIFGLNGVLSGLSAGTVVVDCSTSLPESSRRIAAAVEAAGGHFLDAALTGTPKEANEGSVNLLIGGDPLVLERVRPVLSTFAKNVYHCGPVGAGHTVKLLHQFIVLANAAVLAEAFSCAGKSGVDLNTLCEVINSGGANSTAFQRFKPFVLENRDDLFRFSLGNALKDMDYYTRMATESKSISAIAGAVLASYTVANNQNKCAGAAFVPNLLRSVDKLNGILPPL